MPSIYLIAAYAFTNSNMCNEKALISYFIIEQQSIIPL